MMAAKKHETLARRWSLPSFVWTYTIIELTTCFVDLIFMTVYVYCFYVSQVL